MFTGVFDSIKMYALCAGIGLLGAVCTYGAWKWQGSNIADAVAAAEKVKDEQIRVERTYTKKWRDRAEALSQPANAAKTQAAVVHSTATQAIKAERAGTDKAFYEQVIPAKGVEQWDAARSLMR
jgi:hypothetical protein